MGPSVVVPPLRDRQRPVDFPREQRHWRGLAAGDDQRRLIITGPSHGLGRVSANGGIAGDLHGLGGGAVRLRAPVAMLRALGEGREPCRTGRCLLR